MNGKENGEVILLKKYLREPDFRQDVISLHCFNYQILLCAQSIKIVYVDYIKFI